MKKTVRRAQTISPFGVGSVMDIMGESLIAVDITRWRNAGDEIHERRLEQRLRVSRFKMAPPEPQDWRREARINEQVPYFRFPRWHFCRRCRRMSRVTHETETGESPKCGRCSVPLTPMRFVMACPRGHLDDVPWVTWAHQNRSQGKCERPALQFLTLPGGSGLSFVVVRCETCGARQSLEGIATTDALRKLGIKCSGKQPWEGRNHSVDCDAVPQVLQRGATNLTFSVIESSIEIPPDSHYAPFGEDALKVTGWRMFQTLLELFETGEGDAAVPQLIGLCAVDTGIEPDRIRSILANESRMQQDHLDLEQDDDLLGPEFTALTASDARYGPRDSFIKRHVDIDPYLNEIQDQEYAAIARSVSTLLSDVVQVTRLREVRVLRGFSRLSPPDFSADVDEDAGTFSRYGTDLRMRPKMVPADLGRMRGRDRWLPAIEVYGEGVFLSLDENAVQQWESLEQVRERTRLIRERRNQGALFVPEPTPRLLMLHSLAHVLIRQLSFECGYALASLRERVYSREPAEGSPMAGILIYTSAGDTEGTLGGLVRQGDADRLIPTVVRALGQAQWCSSDPVCRESRGQGPGALNLAACHACCLLPETSCTMYNRLLDRVLLVGDFNNPKMGFFSEVQMLRADRG